jgi:CBS domain-containing protein
MRENGFLKEDWEVGTIAELLRAMPQREVISVDVADPVGKAVTLFKDRGISQVPVTDQRQAGRHPDRVRHAARAGRRRRHNETIDRRGDGAQGVDGRPARAGQRAAGIFERGEVALVVDDDRTVLGLLTKLDLIEMLAARRRPG